MSETEGEDKTKDGEKPGDQPDKGDSGTQHKNKRQPLQRIDAQVNFMDNNIEPIDTQNPKAKKANLEHIEDQRRVAGSIANGD